MPLNQFNYDEEAVHTAGNVSSLPCSAYSPGSLITGLKRFLSFREKDQFELELFYKRCLCFEEIA